MNAIEVEELRKTFPGGVEAVAGLDLVVREGRIFGFLGPNGAGKSTTVRMLTTLLRPTSGRARIAGFDLWGQPHEIRRHIGVAFQEAGLDKLSTGRELLEVQAAMHHMRRADARERAAALLETVGLSDVGDRRVGTYSGGMQRRLDLASALIARPRILFLDEPTTGLDPASRRAIWDEVRRLNAEEGATVFLTTQYLEEADQLVHWVAIIDHGRIVDEGTPAALKGSIGSEVLRVAVPRRQVEAAVSALATLEGVRETRVEGPSLTVYMSNGPETVPQVLRLLERADVPLCSLSVSSPTLDEVFMRATGSRLEGAAAREAS
ncbi:MAG: ATP-binding cassette domain-containing protein [Actinomycetota bacterium]